LEESSYEASDAGNSDDGLGFVLHVGRKSSNAYSHPPSQIIHQLWQIFIENVDPLTKIVHVPSLQPAIQKAALDVERIPPSFEALMFAIYAAAVISLKDDECERRFGEPRETLLSRYISATKSALSRAKFMGTMSIVVLQALVLHLFTVRNIYGPRTVWTLTGVAIRIAEGMGLHRDGASLAVPPFEAEIRRRIWWQLRMHDFRAAELGGLAKFRGFNPEENSCEPPANINDDELYPGMVSPPVSSSKLTDMILCAMRTEIMSFARRRATKFHQQEKDTSKWDDIIATKSDQRAKDGFLDEIEELLESKYLRYCDPSQPLQQLTLLLGRSSLNIVRFQSHHPRRWASYEQIPESEQQYVWKASIALLEQYDIMQSDRRLQGWHAIIHVLDTLRARPLMLEAEKAWRVIEATYQNNSDMISNTKRPIHVAVGNLCLKAYTAREAAFKHTGRYLFPAPDFITKLRQQRETAKVTRQARDAERNKVHVAAEIPAAPDPGASLPLGPINAEAPPQSSSSQMPCLNPTNEGDPFWLTSGLDVGVYDSSGDVMNIDTDFMLSQDYGFEDAGGQSISWSQWDAWLGELNVPPGGQVPGGV
jgi:hypothetical protein